MLKAVLVAGAVIFATSAMAQGTQNQDPATKNMQPQTPASGKTNTPGERPAQGKTMQEKDIGLMNQSGGARPGRSQGRLQTLDRRPSEPPRVLRRLFGLSQAAMSICSSMA
jgi:hypothetical protein